MSPADDYFPGMWKQGPTDPEKKKLERRLENIDGAIILLLVVIGLLLGGDMNLGLILIVICLIAAGVTAKFVIRQVFNHSRTTTPHGGITMQTTQLSFLEGPHTPFLPKMVDALGPDIVGIFGIFSVKKQADNSEEIVESEWGYGNVKENLKRLLKSTAVSPQYPRYFGYRENVANPEETLKELRASTRKPSSPEP